MAKLGSAANASVSQYPPVGYHMFEITEYEYKTFGSGAEGYIVDFKIVGSEDKPDAVGRSLRLNYITVKSDGTALEIGLSGMKKLVLVTHGKDESENEDFELDELVGKFFYAQLSVKEKDGNENANLSKHTAAE